MNNYFALRKANRLREQFVSENSRKQIREIIRYLRRTSWDVCGVELVRSDLIDLAIHANEEGNELFHVIADADTFVQEVKPSLRRLSWFDFFTITIPLFCFFGWGVEGLFLLPLIPDFRFELSLGYLIQFAVSCLASYYLFRRMMERVGFPPREHRLKCAVYMVLYIMVLYMVGAILHQTLGGIVFTIISLQTMAIGGFLLGAVLLWVRFYWYGKDLRLTKRL